MFFQHAKKIDAKRNMEEKGFNGEREWDSVGHKEVGKNQVVKTH